MCSGDQHVQLSDSVDIFKQICIYGVLFCKTFPCHWAYSDGRFGKIISFWFEPGLF